MAERLTFIALDAEEYWLSDCGCGRTGVSGGQTYDALLARCALKAKAETILYVEFRGISNGSEVVSQSL